MNISDDEIKLVVSDIKNKMVSGELNTDITICVRTTGRQETVEGGDGTSLSMGDKFADDDGSEIEVLRVIDKDMTLALNQKALERSNEIRAVLDKKFYISYSDNGKVRHGLVQLESAGVRVLPRYQERVGMDFIKHKDMLDLNPKVSGNSLAAKVTREMIKIHHNHPEQSVPELYQQAAVEVSKQFKSVPEAKPEPPQRSSRRSFRR